MAGKARRRAVAEAAAHARPQSVGADQRDAALLERVAGRERRDGDAVAVHGEILDPGAEVERDVGWARNRVEQHRLQVAAMDHPIGRAVALLDGGAERRAGEHAGGGRVHHAQLLRRDHAGLELLAEPERDQDARGIGRELDAGADLLQPLRLLEQRDAEAALRDRQGGGQPADPRAGDDDGARGRHGHVLRYV